MLCECVSKAATQQGGDAGAKFCTSSSLKGLFNLVGPLRHLVHVDAVLTAPPASRFSVRSFGLMHTLQQLCKDLRSDLRIDVRVGPTLTIPVLCFRTLLPDDAGDLLVALIDEAFLRAAGPACGLEAARCARRRNVV